jgi:hypothetical protein
VEYVCGINGAQLGLNQDWYLPIVRGSPGEKTRVARCVLWSEGGDACAHCLRPDMLEAFVRRIHVGNMSPLVSARESRDSAREFTSTRRVSESCGKDMGKHKENV